MEKINSEARLKIAIAQWEAVQAEEGKMLRQQFHQAWESVKPVNLIKSTFHEVAGSEELKDKLVNTTVGLAAGYVAEKIFEGGSKSPVRKLLGTLLMYGVTSAVARNPEVVKSLGIGLLKIVTRKTAGVSGRKE